MLPAADAFAKIPKSIEFLEIEDVAAGAVTVVLVPTFRGEISRA
jgi:hypothetical protein